MTTTWKVVLPVAVVVLVAAAVLLLRSPGSPPTTPTPVSPEQQTTTSATSQAADQGSADAMVAELLEIAAAEQTSFNEETGDASLVASDSAELNALLTAYDASQY